MSERGWGCLNIFGESFTFGLSTFLEPSMCVDSYKRTLKIYPRHLGASPAESHCNE